MDQYNIFCTFKYITKNPHNLGAFIKVLHLQIHSQLVEIVNYSEYIYASIRLKRHNLDKIKFI